MQQSVCVQSTHTEVHVYPCVTCVSLLLDCSLKVKDVLREFDADGSLARHRHGEVRGRCVLLFTIRSAPPKLAHSDVSYKAHN